MVPLRARYHNSAHFILSCPCQHVKEISQHFQRLNFITLSAQILLFIMYSFIEYIIGFMVEFTNNIHSHPGLTEERRNDLEPDSP